MPDQNAEARERLVVMGVSGSGKSVIGAALAAELDLPFLDADSIHPEANVLKMTAGTPLTDDDRRPWLAAVGAAIAQRPASVTACSSLRRAYRDALRDAAGDLFFVHLDGTPTLLAERLGSRMAHFMPMSLLGSQLATLEPLAPDERGVTVDVTPSVPEIVASILKVAA